LVGTGGVEAPVGVGVEGALGGNGGVVPPVATVVGVGLVGVEDG